MGGWIFLILVFAAGVWLGPKVKSGLHRVAPGSN